MSFTPDIMFQINHFVQKIALKAIDVAKSNVWSKLFNIFDPINPRALSNRLSLINLLTLLVAFESKLVFSTGAQASKPGEGINS